MEAILFIGIPGAGKSTFYMERFFHTHVRLSLDVLRTRERERRLVRACLKADQRFVIDNTNVTALDRLRFIAPAKEAGFRITGYFFEPDPKGSFERNERRHGKQRVPPAGLFGMLKKLERPSWEEGFTELFRVTVLPAGGFEVERWD